MKYYVEFHTFPNICCDNNSFVRYIWMRLNEISDKEIFNLLIYLSFISVISIFNFHVKSEDNGFFHILLFHILKWYVTKVI